MLALKILNNFAKPLTISTHKLMYSKICLKQLYSFKPNNYINLSMISRQKFYYSTISIKDMKITYDPSKKTQILSLNQQQLQQLGQMTPYMTSISFLQKNNLSKSLEYLNYAINEAKSSFPESINLHMCLLNRKSILLKLLSQNQQFVTVLEEIFFLGQSLKGLKNLDTQKHLNNYLLSLLFFNKQKMSLVIQFVQGLDQIISSPKLQKNIENFKFFDAISDILVKNQIQKGFSKLQELPETTFQQKYFKTNNTAWMKYVNWKHTSKTQSQFSKKIKDQGEQLLKKYLRALFDMEYCVPENISANSQNQIPKNTHLVQLLKQYLVQNVKQLRLMPDKVKLANPQSHIVTMNIASLLFQYQRYEQCVYFMKISLSAALDSGQVQRVGSCLLLLAKINFKSMQGYEQILLGILQNTKNYPVHIIKECLSLYSQYLFKQHRYIEAESYANQMMKLQGNLDLEGLLLPEYDFSY